MILRGIDCIQKGIKIPSRTDITVRHTDTLKITRHIDTPMIQRWMSASVTMKLTKNREILGLTDITARHTDTQEMTKQADSPGI